MKNPCDAACRQNTNIKLRNMGLRFKFRGESAQGQIPLCYSAREPARELDSGLEFGLYLLT